MVKVAMLYTGHSNANAVRPLEVRGYLEARGHEVVPVDLLDLAYTKVVRIKEPFMSHGLRHGLLGGKAMVSQMRKWADVIQREVLDVDRFDAIICMSFLHAHILTRDLPCIKIYDCPTPAVDELEYSGEYSDEVIEALRKEEMDIYRSSDHVLFHWDTYREYVRKYRYDGPNLVTLSYGCHLKDERARFAQPPRAVYLGYLGGYWAGLDMLSTLSRKEVCDIDVYGFPRPDKDLGLNYKGFADGTDILTEYQLGLITCSRDRLRSEGFSAKHLEYISYGLPVLVPEWRTGLELIKGSVPYNEENFGQVVAWLSDEDNWTGLSDQAYEQAKDLSWDNTLKGLEGICGG
jgi:hypothetical protein